MLAAAADIDKKSAEAANNKDIATYMSMRWNSPDYTILDMGKFYKGFDGFKKAFMDWVATLKESKFEFTETQNTVSGDVVIGQHKWKAEQVGQDGVRKHQIGLYSDVKAFRDGKWVVISETYVKLPDAPVATQKPSDDFGEEAYNKGDIEGTMAHFWHSPDMIIMDEGRILQGYDAYKADLERMLAARKPGEKFELFEKHEIPLGETFVTHGRWRYVIPPKTYEGLFTNVKALKDGKWVIVLSHYSDGKLK